MTAREIKVLTASPTLCKAALGGGDLRYLRYAQGFGARGLQLEWHVCESDFTADDLNHWPIQLRQFPERSALPVGQQRLAMLDGLLDEALRLPPRSAVVVAPAFSIDGPTLRRLLRARRQRIPLVFNTTMMPEPSSAALTARVKERLLIAVAMRLLARVIAQTERTKAELQARAWLPSSQVDVIGNGVDLGLFQPATADQRAAARQRFGIPDDAGPIYLMVGSLIPRKGLHHLLEAWPRVLATQPAARLLVAGGTGQRLTGDAAGTTHSPYVEKIHRQIAALPQPDSVQLLGSVADTQVCYHAADIFAFASEREGLPNVVLEAMACGLPCLLADYAGIPAEGEELGTSGQQHLRSVRSARELAAGMIRLGKDPDLRGQLGQAARRWMVATQDLERILDQWAALYRQVAGKDAISLSPLRQPVVRP